MPQKQNPVEASALLALAHQGAALRSGLTAAATHQHQRDGAAWFTEWMLVPAIMLGTAAALKRGVSLTASLQPDTDKMAATIKTGLGLIHAEALSFALAEKMPRPEAQKETKRLCRAALETARPLAEVARSAHPELHQALFETASQLGQAPSEARHFAARVRAL